MSLLTSSVQYVQTMQTDFTVPRCRVTDATGEIHNLITEQQFPAGVYRVEFDTKAYWKNEGSTPFHEVAEVSINITTSITTSNMPVQPLI